MPGCNPLGHPLHGAFCHLGPQNLNPTLRERHLNADVAPIGAGPLIKLQWQQQVLVVKGVGAAQQTTRAQDSMHRRLDNNGSTKARALQGHGQILDTRVEVVRQPACAWRLPSALACGPAPTTRWNTGPHSPTGSPHHI